MSLPQDAVPRILCPPLGLLPPNSPPTLYQSNLDHFLHNRPWTAKYLSPASPSKEKTFPFIPQCRNPASPAIDQFFGVTLANPNAVALTHMLCFFTVDDEGQEGVLQDPKRRVEKVSTLYELGKGLNGNPDILHGGMTMAMVDEAMGALLEVNSALGKEGDGFKSVSVTASLEIKFLRPVPTGQAVIATAWIEWIERRKTRVRCEVRDQHGEELARVVSTWVAIKAKV